MFISKLDLDDIEDASNDSPGRLIRNLIGFFFPKAVLSVSSAFGSREIRL